MNSGEATAWDRKPQAQSYSETAALACGCKVQPLICEPENSRTKLTSTYAFNSARKELFKTLRLWHPLALKYPSLLKRLSVVTLVICLTLTCSLPGKMLQVWLGTAFHTREQRSSYWCGVQASEVKSDVLKKCRPRRLGDYETRRVYLISLSLYPLELWGIWQTKRRLQISPMRTD